MKICYKHFILDIPDINIRQLNNKKKKSINWFLDPKDTDLKQVETSVT